MWSTRVVSDLACVPVVRREVDRYLDDQGVTMRRADIAVLVSELVSNGVRHGAQPVTAMVSVVDGVVHIGVEDASPEGPEVAAPPDGGHGIRLVEALSDAWGVEWRTPTGKVVWADIGIDV
jgi:anti-sigma regulatory factor (Ser/Thr protein kinase)